MRRDRKPPPPIDPVKAAIVAEDLRDGRGLDAGMRRAKVSERTVFQWLKRGGDQTPEGEPYRKFLAEYAAALRSAPSPLEAYRNRRERLRPPE